MPRRAVLVTLIAFFSLGLLFGRPVFSETAEAPAPITAEEAAALRGDLKLIEQKVRHLHEITKITSERNWNRLLIMLSIIGIVVAVVAVYVPFIQ